MKTRIVTALVLIAIVLGWLYWADFAIYTVGALAMYAVAAKEMGPLLGFERPWPFLLVAAAAASACFYVAPPGLYIVEGVPRPMLYLTALSIPFWVVMLPVVRAYPQGTGWHKNKALNLVVGLLLLVPFLEALLILRATNFNDNYYEGANLVLAVMALVWAADSGAYFTGRAMGKNKLIPAVSPNKTREGLYGGLATAILVMMLGEWLGLYSHYADDQLAFMVAGLCAIGFSVLGDLVESMLKRMTGVKDSGRLFPGHGGMLDRIDSQLAALPLFVSVHALVSGQLV